jgi:hypothetical protein
MTCVFEKIVGLVSAQKHPAVFFSFYENMNVSKELLSNLIDT